MNRFLIIAIDGGAATGKSSTSKRLAEKHNFLHVDTGSHYRSIAYHLIQANLDVNNVPGIAKFLQKLPVDTVISNGQASIILNNRPIPPADLRTPEVNSSVSRFASIPEVRTFLKSYQQSQEGIAKKNNFNGLIMEGRDIGTVIFPNADLIIFLDANPETRELRRKNEGISDSIAERDKLDLFRKTAPLACSPKAIKIDTSLLSLDQVISQISQLIENIGETRMT